MSLYQPGALPSRHHKEARIPCAFSWANHIERARASIICVDLNNTARLSDTVPTGYPTVSANKFRNCTSTKEENLINVDEIFFSFERRQPVLDTAFEDICL
jgi:hypothetical protein